MLSPVIEIGGLTERYGERAAVDDLTVRIRPGRVTATSEGGAGGCGSGPGDGGAGYAAVGTLEEGAP